MGSGACRCKLDAETREHSDLTYTPVRRPTDSEGGSPLVTELEWFAAKPRRCGLTDARLTKSRRPGWSASGRCYSPPDDAGRQRDTSGWHFSASPRRSHGFTPRPRGWPRRRTVENASRLQLDSLTYIGAPWGQSIVLKDESHTAVFPRRRPGRCGLYQFRHRVRRGGRRRGVGHLRVHRRIHSTADGRCKSTNS